MKKTITMLLVAAMLTGMLSACGEPAEPVVAAKDDSTGMGTTTGEDMALRPDLPQVYLGGYAFRTYTRDTDHHIKEVYSEELNGEIVNDAVYARNSRVEDLYNVKLVAVEVTEEPEETMPNEFSRIVMAGEDAFDVALMHTVYAGSTAISGVAYNWLDVPYVDFEKPWWNRVLAEELTYNDMLFLAVSDYCISAIDYTWTMVYNRDMARDYGIGDLYDTVEKGDWDFDTFRSLCAQVTTDLNGNGEMDYDDRYGFVTHSASAICNWSFAFDIRYVSKDSDGVPQLLPASEKMMTSVEKLYGLFFEDRSALFCDAATIQAMGYDLHDTAITSTFKEGKALFAAMCISVIDMLRDMEGEFGIIPFPKYDKAQDGYYTHVDGHAPLMILPKTLQNAENAGIVMEALAYESCSIVVPAVCDVVLQSKYARDEASARMLDIVLAGRVYTFGYMYDNWQGMQWTLTNMMGAKNKDYASYYARQEKAAENQLKNVLDGFAKLGS